MRYRDAGVDIDQANQIVRGIGRLAPSTWGPRVLSNIGSFGGLFDLQGLGTSPVLVCSVDGVGTKMQVAKQAGNYSGIGEDLVHHSVNDILVQGARPLLFLDYVAAAKLEEQVVLALVEGMTRACGSHACALLGGETAEMPGTYTPGDYDLVGCIVGIAERDRLLTGQDVRVGDSVWGVPSSGLHTNGYSLARRVLLEKARLPLHSDPGGLGMTLAEALLAPHRSYFASLWPLIDAKRLKALAHITGGGFVENIPRVLPPDCDVEIRPDAWEIPPLFQLIQAAGDIAVEEMRRVFNLGIGMVVLLDPEHAPALRESAPDAVQLGVVTKGTGRVRFTA